MKEFIEIPFGAKDSELCGWEYTIPEGFVASIENGKIIVKKEEGEDEKIRKEIIEYLRFKYEDPNAIRHDYEKWIAWLEKQDPKKHEEELENAYKTADEVQYKRGYEDAVKEMEKQVEHKPFDYENANIQQKDFAPKVEPNPAWSVYDEEFLRRAIKATKDVYPMTAKWLESLKERMKGE